MKRKMSILVAALVTVAATAQNQPPSARDGDLKPSRMDSVTKADQAKIEQVISTWPARPKVGALMMLSKYGAPSAVTAEKLVWENQGPYKRITVTKKEDHHDFPLPHTDFMEHTVSYNVPADKTEELSTYDGSCTFDRTQGELSARCDLEGHNILTLNLAHDIATGKKNVNDARKVFGEIVVQDTLGKHPPYVEKLNFQPVSMAAFADTPVIPGAPVRPDAKRTDQKLNGSPAEGEALGTLIGMDMNVIVAAMVASQRRVAPEVAQYAKMLHEQHGMSVERTMKLGQNINVTPLSTKAVDALREKGAGELAMIMRLDGREFSDAYVGAMIKSHGEALQMIESQLLPKASNQELKQHLTKTRQSVAARLQAAQRLQSGAAVGGPPTAEKTERKQSASQPPTAQ